MLDDPKKEGLTTPDTRAPTQKEGLTTPDTRAPTQKEGLTTSGGDINPPHIVNPSTHAVRPSRCQTVTLPHSRTRELRNPHKPENPTGKPDSKPPPEATSRTPDPRTGPQVGHKACIAPTIQTLTWGFLKEVRHTVRLVDSHPLSPVETTTSAEQRPRGRRRGGINVHAIAAVQQICDPRASLLEILIPRSGQDHRASTVDPRI